jgi:hypothetical protein
MLGKTAVCTSREGVNITLKANPERTRRNTANKRYVVLKFMGERFLGFLR